MNVPLLVAHYIRRMSHRFIQRKSIFFRLFIDSNDSLIRLEVRATCVVCGGHPHELRVAVLRLRIHAVCKDDQTVEAVGVAVGGWRVEVSTSTRNTLPLTALAFLPSINLVTDHLIVKRDNGRLRQRSQLD